LGPKTNTRRPIPLAPTTRYQFGKKDKLKSRKAIQELFAEGKYMNQFPLRAVYVLKQSDFQLQAGVSVSSRFFKKAVDRNRAKRVVREAYRLQKNNLEEILTQHNQALSIFFIYNSNVKPHFEKVYESCGAIIKQLITISNAAHQKNS
jgi:ribonuclease P protein component